MKKLLAFLLCLMMILSLGSCDINNNHDDLSSNENGDSTNLNNDSTNDSSTVPDTSADSITNTTSANYDSVLEVYRRIVDSYPIVNQNPRALAAELGIQGEEDIQVFIELYYSVMVFYPGRVEADGESPHYKLDCGYSAKDLNGDGVDELVLMNNDYYIMAIFSCSDGKPVLLGNYWERNYCWIDGEGLLHNNGSSGAAYSTNAVYKIADGGAKLELIVEFGTNGVEWVGDTAYTIYYKLVNGEKATITEAEYNDLSGQYNKYLGSVAGATATKEYAGLTFTPLFTEAEIAMEMYEAAIRDEISVFDEHLGEIKLKACRFPSDNLRLDECEILYKAILDMDGDGINEYVIQSSDKDHIVLHYYDGKVYSYCFDSKNFFNLNTDGSFYWNDSSESGIWIRGLNQSTFNGPLFSIKEIYKIIGIDPLDGHNDYYMEGRQVTREEYLDYYYANYKIRVTFSPLDISCEYPISSERACEIADVYWKGVNGHTDGAAGTTIFHRVVLLSKPSSDSTYYRIGWQMEDYSHIYDGWESLSPHNVQIYKELLVDAITGECREYIKPEIDGKG